MVKKQLIMDKALELFAKQGFESTSVQQITEHCGISKGAFYLSFKSKDELILALIDHFMMQITTDIDYIVRNTNKKQLLYEFYKATYRFFHQHSDFARIFMKEQTQTFNQDLFKKMHEYDLHHGKVILTLIERLYGDSVEETKYDLVYSIKGFMKMYAEILLFNSVNVDFDLLTQSLVEKTNLLAKHVTIPFVSRENHNMLECTKNEVTQEELLEILQQRIAEMDESIEKDSLILLEEHLQKPTYSPAIVNGLIGNIRNHPHCKWIAYLLRNYFGIQ